MQTISYAEIAARMKSAGVPTGTPPPSPAKASVPAGKRAAIDYVRPVDEFNQANFGGVTGIAMALLCKHENRNGVTEFVSYDGMRWRLVNGKGERYTPGRGWMPYSDKSKLKAALAVLNGEAVPIYRPTIDCFQRTFDEASRAFLPPDQHPPLLQGDPWDEG